MAPTPAITFTLDLEDHRPNDAAPLHYPEVTRRILGKLDDWGVTGTFFVVGVVAEAQPDLVREVAAAGHEIALHGWTHTPLTELTPARFAEDLARGKSLLDGLSGTDVVGFRAPTFSLTADTVWATDVLTDAGFTYSSSVLPTANPLYGFPGAPGDPFRWPSGLAELPVPIAGPARLRVPYLGGTYLRLIPHAAIARAHARSGRRVPWTYVHPYDADTDERFWVVPDAGWMSPLLWVGRGGVIGKLEKLLVDGGPAGPPLRDRLAEADAGGTFDPVSIPRRPLSPVPAIAATSLATPTTESTTMTTDPACGEFSHGTMVHRLPKAPLVNRIEYLTAQARDKRVVHVGFVDTGCREMQEKADAWLHGHLGPVAKSLVGIDVDVDGVAAAVAAGHEAYVADCRDPSALQALGLEPAELVIAGEVIEHLDDPGAFLAGLHALVAPGGELIVTTPNAYGLFNVFASLARREINHPDHVVMFTWRTLTNLAARHGWETTGSAVYVPKAKDLSGSDLSARLLGVAAGVTVGIERALARSGRSFAADGMIVSFRSTRA